MAVDVTPNSNSARLINGPFWNMGSTFTLFMQFQITSTSANNLIGRRKSFTDAGFRITVNNSGKNMTLLTYASGANSHVSENNIFSTSTWDWFCFRGDGSDVHYYSGIAGSKGSDSFTAPSAISPDNYELAWGADNRNDNYNNFAGYIGHLAIGDFDVGADGALALVQGVSPRIVAPGSWAYYWPLANENDLNCVVTGHQFTASNSPAYVAGPNITDRRRRQVFHIPPPGAGASAAVITANEMTVLTATDTASVVGAVVTGTEQTILTPTDTASAIGAFVTASEMTVTTPTDTASVIGAVLTGAEMVINAPTDTASTIGAIIAANEMAVLSAADSASAIGAFLTASELSITTVAETATVSTGGVISANEMVITMPTDTAGVVGAILTASEQAIVTAADTAAVVGAMVTANEMAVLNAAEAASVVGAILTASEQAIDTAMDQGGVTQSGVVAANEMTITTEAETAGVVGAFISANEMTIDTVMDTGSVVGAMLTASEMTLITAEDGAGVIGAILTGSEQTIITGSDTASIATTAVIQALEMAITTAADTATVVSVSQLALALDPAAVAEEIVTYLTANLGGNLTAIETAQADGIELGTAQYANFPAEHYEGELNIVVYPVRTEPISGGDTRQRHTVNIEVIAAGQQDSATLSTSEVLGKRAQRVAQGVLDTVNNSDLGGQVGRVFVQNVTFDTDSFDNSGLERRVLLEADIFTSVT